MAAVFAGAAEGRGAHALGNAFQQVLQGIQSMQEAFLAQERRLNDLERAWQEDRQATVARANEGAGALAPDLEERLQRLGQRMEEVERRLLPSEGQETAQMAGVEERMTQLESRMGQLETSIERGLQSVLPRVDALLMQLEKPTPLVVPHATSISVLSSNSGASFHPSSPSSSSAPPPVLCRLTTSPGSAAALERRKELGEQLLQAAKMGREIIVQRLLDEGADVNYSHRYRYTALMYAVNNSHVNVVSRLIAKGANVHARDIPGDTALHFSSFKDKSGRCTSLLIGAGALVDSANCSGHTPLHIAVMTDNEAAARALLAANASTAVRDKSGKMPSQYARNDRLEQLFRP